MIFNSDIVISEDFPDLQIKNGLKCDLFKHQSKIAKCAIDMENAITYMSQRSKVTHKIGRYIIKIPMGSGKTRTAIAIINESPRPAIRPIWITNTHNMTKMCVSFKTDKVIDPTFVFVQPLVMAQWIREIADNTRLRAFVVKNSKTTNLLLHDIFTNLREFNSQWDVVLVSCKKITGDVSNVLNKSKYIFHNNNKKTKYIHDIILNCLTGHYIRRAIYDDWDLLGIRNSLIGNFGICVYLSATSKYYIKRYNEQSFSHSISRYNSMQTYYMTICNMNPLPTIKIFPEFLYQSLSLSDTSDHAQKMMPEEPLVMICQIKTPHDDAMAVLDMMTSDENIIENINNMSVKSVGGAIISIMDGKHSEYCKSVNITNKYTQEYVESLLTLPEDPCSISEENLLRIIEDMEEIKYSYSNIGVLIESVVNKAKEFIKASNILMSRVLDRLVENTCPICFEEATSNKVYVIMRCCSRIMHSRCVILHNNLRRCPVCRTLFSDVRGNPFTVISGTMDMKTVIVPNNSPSEPMIDLTKLPDTCSAYVTKHEVICDIIAQNYDNIQFNKATINNHRNHFIFSPREMSENTNLVQENAHPIKALIYCSSDSTIKQIKNRLESFINTEILTGRVSNSTRLLREFRTSDDSMCIISNTWRNAGGIDFKAATDIIVVNYVDSDYDLVQMMARGIRIGRRGVLRIWILAYINELFRWNKSQILNVSN